MSYISFLLTNWIYELEINIVDYNQNDQVFTIADNLQQKKLNNKFTNG